MAGRIVPADVVLVRERADLADVVREHVALRNAGGGSLKGLCPFHDEKTPSFNVRPQLGYWRCFGCGESGDVFDFVQKIDALSFSEAVERLAGRAGVQLHYENAGYTPGRQQGQRTRLVEAHRAAAEFYAEQLASSPESGPGRRFLSERGFDSSAAERFGVGYAPDSWDALTRHLRGRGFTEEELRTGGLARDGSRGALIDRFRGRLMWPIRDRSGEVVGFGARKLRDDDSAPKYLNSPETPIYKKSQVLYGVDLAKREIARRLQAVVVEGYTDVMACHLSGVETAVATCGTAFGEEHVRILRQLLLDQSEFRGEVIFTFDGDEAGQKAALKAAALDQRFVTQTFVAVTPEGQDPCDLRQSAGPEAVRDLVARRVPLFEFVIRHALDRHDLDTADGRVGALREAAPLVAGIRDRSLRPEYARALAGWLGMEVEAVIAVITRAGAPTVPATGARAGGSASTDARPDPAAGTRPDPADPALLVEREVLKLALQAPASVGAGFDALEPVVFTAAPYAAVDAAVAAAGGTASGMSGETWVTLVREAAPSDAVRDLVTELAVEPVRVETEDGRYASSLLARLEELAATRRVAEVKSRLQRLSPVESPERYNKLFGELVALEQHRRGLRERGVGAL
ncbi:MAG: DNA primase [Actinomycetota bacterium]|nr:DNA primase [Actinomycetota bacterium]